MAERAENTHLHDTPLGSGFRFSTEIIAWVTGTWVAGLVHPIWGLAALIVMVGLPTVFTTTGDKKHTMVNTPGPLRALIDLFQFAIAALPEGECLPESRTGSLPEARFRPERKEDMKSQILVRMDGSNMLITTRPIRRFDENAKSVFERDWPAWLTGGIYDLETDGDQPR